MGRPTIEQKQVGWELTVMIEKIITTVLNEAHERQVEGDDGDPSRGAGGILQSYTDRI